MFKKLTLLLCFIVVCTSLQPAQAQVINPDVKVTQAWQGYTRVPGWAEVEYAIHNEGEDLAGTLTIYDAANTVTYQANIDLPTQSQKTFRIPVLSTDGFDLTTILQDDDQLDKQFKIPIIDLDNNRVCAYIGSQASAQLLTLPDCDNFIQLQSLTEIPETPMVWDNVDLLIINGTNTHEISDKQSTSMTAWVASGGHLIISGGMSLKLALAPLPTLLQIATAGPVDIAHSIPGADTEAEGIASTQLQPKPESESLIKVNSTVYAVRKSLGRGVVDIIGWDISHISDTTWLHTLWKEDPIPATANRIFGNGKIQSQISPSMYDLQEITQNPMPKMWLWYIIFLLYIFCIGPGTMLLIKYLQKPIYTWILIPGWIAIALLIVSGLFSSTYGQTFPLVHDIAYIFNYGTNLPARVVQGTAVTAPQSRHINWSSAGYLRPLWGQHAVDTWDYSGTAYPFTIEIDTSQSHLKTEKPKGVITWGVEGIIDATEIQSELAVAFHKNSPYVIGTITSQTNLKNVNLVWRGRSSQTIRLIDNAEAYHSTPISATLPTALAYPEMSYSVCGFTETPFSAPMVKPIRPPGIEEISDLACYITALSLAVPFPTSDIAGSYTGESCIIQEIACPKQLAGPLQITLMGDSNGKDGGWVDTQMDIVSPFPPASIFTYHLPDYINVRQVNAISIKLTSHDGNHSQTLIETDSVRLSIWDWQKETWLEQTPQMKSNLTGLEFHISGSGAGQYFDPKQHTIEIKLQIPENTYPQFYMPIRIEGIW